MVILAGESLDMPDYFHTYDTVIEDGQRIHSKRWNDIFIVVLRKDYQVRIAINTKVEPSVII